MVGCRPITRIQRGKLFSISTVLMAEGAKQVTVISAEKEIEHKEKNDTPLNPLVKKTNILNMWTVGVFF